MLKKIIALFAALVLCTSIANAKEPTNWFFGAGFGAGYSKIDTKYPDAASNKMGITWHNWTDTYSSNAKDFGFNWEVLLGYKHFINDWVGFRYFANVGSQHYKDEIFTAGNVKAGVIEYTANIDLLVNFWSTEQWSIGAFAGVGVGGAYFDSPAFDRYLQQWHEKVPNTGQNPTTDPSGVDLSGVHKGEGNIYKHHISASVNVGIRGSYFQKVRNINQRVCNNREDGRRTCRVPISYFEHSFEFNARFPLMKYKVTDPGDIVGAYSDGVTGYPGTAGKYISIYKRPGYVVSNPFKFTIRYIFAF